MSDRHLFVPLFRDKMLCCGSCVAKQSRPRNPVLECSMQLLRAAGVGDLAGVEALLASGFVDVNQAYGPQVVGDDLLSDKDFVHAQTRQKGLGTIYFSTDCEVLPVGSTALILASRADHVEVVRRLLKEAGIDCNLATSNVVNPALNHQTALIWASRHGHIDAVRALLADERVDVNATSRREQLLH